MKKISQLIICICILLMQPLNISAENEVNINADAYILIEKETGQILISSNETQKAFPASTTKIMTGILGIENGDFNKKMIATKEAVYDIGKDGMNIGIQPDEQLYLEDLLNAMLIVSANEAANIIAENVCDTRQEFVDLMNEKAKQIGALDTNFANTNGMHDENHYTTAADLAKIAAYAMQNDLFNQIVNKPYYDMSATNKHSKWNRLYTVNPLIKDKPENKPYEVYGIKTGYTNPAGKCFVTSAKNSEGTTLIAVIMGVRESNSAQKIGEYALELFDYGFSRFKLVELVNNNTYLGYVPVKNAENDEKVVLISNQEKTAVVDKDFDENLLTTKIEQIEDITAPITLGDVVAKVAFMYQGEKVGEVDAIAANDINLKPITSKNSEGLQTGLIELLPLWLKIPLIVFITLFILVLYLKIANYFRKKKRKKKRLERRM